MASEVLRFNTSSPRPKFENPEERPNSTTPVWPAVPKLARNGIHRNYHSLPLGCVVGMSDKCREGSSGSRAIVEVTTVENRRLVTDAAQDYL
jgi:hypothetical protein